MLSSSPRTTAQTIGNEHAVPFHVSQDDINSGQIDIKTLVEAGRFLFEARFTALDGAGRPGSTGSGLPTRRPLVNARAFLRTSGPDANACSSCHNRPEIGSSGDFVANVFVGAQEREPVLFSVSQELSAERGTTAMNGSGLIELLAREMTRDLHHLRDAAVAKARREHTEVQVDLLTKGVGFGSIRAFPDGTVSTTNIEGIDKDLVVRPWSQKGVVTSLRTFSVTALNHHHGMQATERFGIRRTGSLDFDRDGIIDEITEGDVTALVLFQATLPVPTIVLPLEPARIAASETGRRIFGEIGCADCHRPTLPLESSVYTEPGNYNLEGTLRLIEVPRPFAVDLAALDWGGRLKRDSQARVLVEAFTDLKRHRIADSEEPFLANEVVSQGFAPTDEFITKRLWDVGNTAPYGHRGDVTTLDEIILRHGGEARSARGRYASLQNADRLSVIEFLKTLQIVPMESIPEPPSNRLSARLEALANRWKLQFNQSLVSQLLTRSEAAAMRAESSRDHLRSLVMRIESERKRIREEKPAASDQRRWLPEKPPMLSNKIGELLGRTATDKDLLQALNAIEREEQALNDSFQLAEHGLELASIANPGEPRIPIGHLDSSLLYSNVESLVSAHQQISALRELVTWCEDLTFRVEQLSEQVAMAELRIEAMASQRVRGEANHRRVQE